MNTVSLCVSGPDGEPILEITQNVTAVLGEGVYLGCRYLGKSEIVSAVWKRQINSKVKSKGLAGFSNGEPFSRNGFSDPESLTNLTVKMNVSNVGVEGEYNCEFESKEEYYSDSVFLTVVGKPIMHVILLFIHQYEQKSMEAHYRQYKRKNASKKERKS